MEFTEELFYFFLIIGSIIFIMVLFYTAYFSWKFRQKHPEKVPPQKKDNTLFELGIIGVAFILVAIFFGYTVYGMESIQDIPPDLEPDLIITGHQWWWEIEYPKDHFYTANEMHIPKGKRLLVRFNSEDVVHSWWVPQLARKMDMIPGQDNYMWLEAPEEGIFEGNCSEFCGAQHAHMKIQVRVDDSETYTNWKIRQQEAATSSGDSLFLTGKGLFQTRTCASCHTTDPNNKEPNIGPNLAHFASRDSFLSNTAPLTKKNLEQWIKNPEKLKPGTKMPNLVLSEDEVTALVHYLEQLK